MKIKKYIDCYIPTETCNLRCHYCYITQQKKFNNKMVKFEHKPSIIRKALSIKRLGGVCLFNLCAGGETLLGGEIIDVIRELLVEGHYVMVVTNGTLTNRFNEILQFPKELLKRLIFKFSFHYLELTRINKIDLFFNNINNIRRAGCSFTLEITPNDELIPHINEIKNICLEKTGALCHVSVGRDDRTKNIKLLSRYSYDEYKKIWGIFNSELFDYKMRIFGNKRREFCYAGDWSYYINLVTGSVRQCYCGKEIDNLYNDIDKPLNAEAIGTNCILPHCYNGHAFLTLGVIPELQSPTYAEMRNRIDSYNNEWLQDNVKEFIGCKLRDNNELYSDKKMRKVSNKGRIFKTIDFSYRIGSIIKKRIRGTLNEYTHR